MGMGIDDEFDFRPLKPSAEPPGQPRQVDGGAADASESEAVADPESLRRLLASRSAAIEQAAGMSLPKKTTIDKLTARREALAEARRRVEFKKRKKSGGLYEDE